MTSGSGVERVSRVTTRQNGLAFETFGNPAIPHRTDTDAGTLRIVSSWPANERASQNQTEAAVFVHRDFSVAIQLALDLAGSAAGGFRCVYEALDNGTAAYPTVWDATNEIANANTAVDDAATVAFIGGIHTGAVQQSIPILSRAVPSLAVVVPAATWPGLTRQISGITEFGEPGRYAPTGVRNVVRFGPTDDGTGSAAAQWVFEAGGRRTASVFHDNGRYGRCVAISFASAFAALGGTVTQTTALPADPLNFDGHVASVMGSGSDCVFIGGVATPKLSQLIEELRSQVGADGLTIIGGDGLMAEGQSGVFVPELPGGLIAVGPVLPAELPGDGAIWTAVMRYRIGQDRDPHPSAVHAFEAAVAIIQAIDAVGSDDRVTILAAIQATHEFIGLSGTVLINLTGDRELVPYRIAQVEGGRFVTIGRR